MKQTLYKNIKNQQTLNKNLPTSCVKDVLVPFLFYMFLYFFSDEGFRTVHRPVFQN